jgi:hypothetical protein
MLIGLYHCTHTSQISESAIVNAVVLNAVLVLADLQHAKCPQN